MHATSAGNNPGAGHSIFHVGVACRAAQARNQPYSILTNGLVFDFGHAFLRVGTLGHKRNLRIRWTMRGPFVVDARISSLLTSGQGVSRSLGVRPRGAGSVLQ